MPIWFAVVLLGIIEGITEFLPVSSTGHLLIAEQWLPRQSDVFNVVIQCGAVLAVLPLFHFRLNQFIFRWRERATQDYALKLLFAFGLTVVGLYFWTKLGHQLPKTLGPVALALFVGGVAFLVIERHVRGCNLGNNITWTVAFAVGVGQIIAGMFPGTSRSGATILFCLLLGIDRPTATEFSFLVSIPTMIAASAHELLKALHHRDPATPPENWGMILLGTVVSAVVSFIAVKWLLGYIRTHTFTGFGWYRIALAVVIGVLLFAGGH